MTQNYPGLLYIPLLPAAGIYLIYLLLSQILFLYTTAGWSRVIEIGTFGGILPIFWVILLFARLFKVGGFVRKRAWFGLIIIIAIVQLLALLFNYGDCGDGVGQYNYIQRLFVADFFNTLCDRTPATQPLIPMPFIFGIRVFYYLLNFILVVFIITGNKVAR